MPFITEELWIKHNFRKIYGNYLINYTNSDLQLKINKKTIDNIIFFKKFNSRDKICKVKIVNNTWK